MSHGLCGCPTLTRWGVLADIHGNLPALERALAGLRERKAERIAVLGDNLGRGEADRCVEVVRQVADVSVVGNRDLDWQARVGAASAAYVLGLPRLAQADDLVFSHGDARLTRDLASDEIRGGFRRARAWMTAHGCHAWLFGHTHRARVWSLGPPDAPATLHVDAATDRLPARIDLRADGTPTSALWVLNAGSVGLPFGGKGPASAMLFDAVSGVVEIFPV